MAKSGEWDDFLARGGTVDELVARAIDAKVLRDKVDLRPAVWDTDPPLDLKERAVELVVVHNDPPVLFSRGGELVRIVKDEHGHGIRLESKPLFRDRLERSIRVLHRSDSGVHEVPMPTHVLEDLLATAGHGGDFPILR